MTGLLKKKVDKEKIFQKKLYPKRYFIIDYTRAVIQIKHKLDDKKEEKKRKHCAFVTPSSNVDTTTEVMQQIRPYLGFFTICNHHIKRFVTTLVPAQIALGACALHYEQDGGVFFC
jgi:hypothetical protein